MIAGGSWHTDIEYEPLPMHVSMFLVQRTPSVPNAVKPTTAVKEEAQAGEGSGVGSGVGSTANVEDHSPDTASKTWAHINHGADHDGPYCSGSSADLMRLRMALPLNGETPFADTTAAFAALSAAEQEALERVLVRRRLNEGDEGWLAPLVRIDRRTGLKSLHSPMWNSRPQVRPAVEVDGMGGEESRAFLDRLEEHVLQPQFRYDHVHAVGDVTIWHNWMSIHNSPPMKVGSRNEDDTRLMYRLSCKGPPCFVLPRTDDPSWIEANISPPYVSPPCASMRNAALIALNADPEPEIPLL